MTILRKFIVLILCLTLGWTTVACERSGAATQATPQSRVQQTVAQTRLNDGMYPVQQASYDDASGEYNLFLLNTPPGTSPDFRGKNLQLARLTDEEIKAGQKSYLKVENGQPALYLTEDFKIEYVHAVTEAQTNPQTGEQQTVVVRRETGGFWTPFAGALAGQAVGNLLFRPQYYVPPVYQPGASVLRGYGGYGSTYGQAIDRYQTRYSTPPAAVRNNRTNFRTTGRIRTSTTASRPAVRTSPPYNTGSRSTGSGYGTSTLNQSGKSNYSKVRRPSSSSFGSGRSSGVRSGRSSSSFGSRRR